MAEAAPYQTGWTGVDLIQRGQERTLTAPIYLAGALVAPVSGTVTLTDDSGRAVVASAAVVVAASVATYLLLSSATTGRSVAERWREEWVLVMPDGVTHTFSREAMCVYRRIVCPVSQADLTREHPELLRRKDTSVTSLDGWIQTAWAEVVSEIVGTGKMLWLNLDSTALWMTVRFRALASVYRSLSEGDASGRDFQLAQEYAMRAATAWATVTLVQADPETGQPTGKRRAARPSQWI